MPLLLYGAAAFHTGPVRRGIGVCGRMHTCGQRPRRQVFCNHARVHLAGVAAWCSDNLPPGSTLLVHDAGYIAYATRFPW